MPTLSCPSLRLPACLTSLLIALGLSGCASLRPAATAHESAVRHNEWVDSIGELWVSARYTSRSTVKGEPRVEAGDADLVLAPSIGGAYLRIGRLGVSLVEITSQPEYCWTIVHPDANPEGKRGVVEIARKKNFGSPCAQQSLAPAMPSELLILAGLVEIPDDAKVARSLEYRRAMAYTFPLSNRKGTVGLVLDAKTGVPMAVTITLPSAEGKPRTITSKLSEVEAWDLGSSAPKLPTTILILAGDGGDSLEIDVLGVSPRSRRRDSEALGLFDPDAMLRRYERYDLRVLDANCPNPTVINDAY